MPDQVRSLAQATDTLCHMLWLLRRREPEVVALVEARGSAGFPHYLTSRLGVLPEEGWAEAVFVSPPALIEHVLPRCRALDPPAYVDASLDAAGRALRRLHPAAPPPVLAEMAAAVSPEAGLARAWAGWPRLGDPHRDAIRDAMVLREARAHGHYLAAAREGLSPLQLLVLTALWRGQPEDVIGRNFKWSPEEIEAAAASLRERGWSGADGSLTAAGVALREGIEAATDRLAEQSLAQLPTARLEQVAGSLSELVSI